MPFDGADFPPPRDPPSRATQNRDTFTVVVLILASCLFLTGALVDVVKSVQGHQAVCDRCSHASGAPAAAQATY